MTKLKTKSKKIHLKVCEDSSMAWVYIDGVREYVGNFWDYHPGCFGTKGLGDFDDPWSYVDALKNKWERHKYQVEVIEEEISEEESERLLDE